MDVASATRARAMLAEGRKIANKARSEDRALTRDEKTRIDAILDAVDRMEADDTLSAIDEIAAAGRRLTGSDWGLTGTGSKYLDLGERFAGQLVAKMRQAVGGKAFTAPGSVITPVPLIPGDPQGYPHALPSLLSVIPVVRREATYRVLSQTTRTINAAPVASGGSKPTSVLTITPTDARLRVIAHLSEPLDRFLLEDEANLQGWVARELVDGLREALQTQILTGNGVGENFTGLGTVSGVTAVPWSTDRITTLAAAQSALENVGVQLAAFALASADWLAISTTRNAASGQFDTGGPVDAATRRAWGVPVVVVPGMTVGVGYGIGQGCLALAHDNAGIRVDWSNQSGDTFAKNQLVGRCEGRFNLDVLRPYGVASIDLTAA